MEINFLLAQPAQRVTCTETAKSQVQLPGGDGQNFALLRYAAVRKIRGLAGLASPNLAGLGASSGTFDRSVPSWLARWGTAD